MFTYFTYLHRMHLYRSTGLSMLFFFIPEPTIRLALRSYKWHTQDIAETVSVKKFTREALNNNP